MERFFVVTPPGFEEEAEREIRECWPQLLSAAAQPHDLPVPAIERRRGGLELETELVAAVQLNFFLKIASRVLWRLDEFRVRDFPKLHAKLKRIDVEGRLGTRDFAVVAAAGSSRLGHERRLEQTAREAWGAKADVEDDPAVLLRLENDVCTVSLDTTGEHLHRRGLNRHRGEAPVRETIAAFGLRKMMENVPAGEVAGITLVDPMCGSGTFLTEAASLWAGHFQREYRFQTFNGLPKLFRQPGFGANYRLIPPPPFAGLRGFDVDEKTVDAAKANARRTEELFPGTKIEIARQDLMAAAPRTGSERVWVVANPPYGERIEGAEPQTLLDRMIEVWRPSRLGVLWTEAIARRLRWPSGSRELSVSRLKNGGIEAAFVVREIGRGS